METLTVSKEKKKLFTPCRAFVGKRAKPILHCGLIKDASASTVPTTALSHVLTALCMCFWSRMGGWCPTSVGGGVKKEAIMETDTHVKCEFLKCEKKSRRLTGSWWCRGTRTWQGQESPTTVVGGGFEDSPGGVLSPIRRSSCGWHVLCLLHIPALTPTSS